MSSPVSEAFDLIVLGAGSGGLAGAFRAAGHGVRVALLDPGPLGGTCVNVGCVPKKAMWYAAELTRDNGLAASLGFAVPQSPGLDWSVLIARRQRYIADIHASYRERLQRAGITVLRTRGRLCGNGIVETAEGERLSAGHVLIATGSRPRRLDVPGAGLAGVSDDFFDWGEAPERVALVGGGYIGVELAGILNALCSRVDVYIRGDRWLPKADAELADALMAQSRQDGIDISTGYRLAALERNAEGRIHLVDEDGRRSEGYDRVLQAVGRVANVEDIGLEIAGVETGDAGHIVVDDCQRTSAPGVLAVGDVVGREPLTPVAIAAARALMDRLFGGKPDARLDYDNIPSVVFSHPPLASVGLTEDEARERHGDAVEVHRSRFRPMLQGLAQVDRRSLFKLVCVGDERRVVGVHLLGKSADEILQGFAVAVKLGATLADLQATVAIHPGSAEEVVLIG